MTRYTVFTIINTYIIYLQEINSFGWYNDTVKNSSITQPNVVIDEFLTVYIIYVSLAWMFHEC